MKLLSYTASCWLWIAATAVPSACGETVQLPAARDNTIYDQCGIPCPDGGSNGAGQLLFAGRTQAFGSRRALLTFDVAAHVPAGATITAAQLRLHVTFPPSGGADVLALHRLTADWGEGASLAVLPGGAGAPPEPGDATWLYRFYDNEPWSASGGDYIATPSAALAVENAGAYVFSGAPLRADVQGWLQDPANNAGWIVIGNESSAGSARRIGSRENQEPALQPSLLLEYTLPPPVPASSPRSMIALAVVLLAALLAGAVQRCRARAA